MRFCRSTGSILAVRWNRRGRGARKGSGKVVARRLVFSCPGGGGKELPAAPPRRCVHGDDVGRIGGRVGGGARAGAKTAMETACTRQAQRRGRQRHARA